MNLPYIAIPVLIMSICFCAWLHGENNAAERRKSEERRRIRRAADCNYLHTVCRDLFPICVPNLSTTPCYYRIFIFGSDLYFDRIDPTRSGGFTTLQIAQLEIDSERNTMKIGAGFLGEYAVEHKPLSELPAYLNMVCKEFPAFLHIEQQSHQLQVAQAGA